MAFDRNLTSPDAEEGGTTPLADVVTLSRDEYETLVAQAGRVEPPAPAAPDPEVRERDFARELAAREQKVAELERAYRSALRDRELATNLAGKPLVAGAAVQLIKLWRDDFDVYEESGEVKVCSRDGRPIVEAIAARLASPEFAHFCLPTSRGGAGTQDANRAAAKSGAGDSPRNLGEAVVQRWREQSAARANDPSRPIGLGRRR